MAGTAKIKDTKMLRMVNDNIPQAEIARHFGVSPAAVCKRLRELRGRTSYAVAASKTAAIIDNKLDVISDLNSINEQTKTILAGAKENPVLALKAISSIQQQISLAITLYEQVYSIDQMNNFNQEVLQVLEECDPALRKKVINRLNAKASLRSAVRFK
jgi:DNA-binding Lrp family transcriptional regulator